MTARVVPGAALVAIGVLFLLGALGVIREPGQVLGAWWPLVFVFIGASLAVEQRRVGVGPLLFLALGAALLVATTDLVDARLVWPVVLIAVGGWLLLGHRWRPGRIQVEESTVEVTSLFGDRHVRGGPGPLEHASLTSLFGDLDVDLTSTRAEDDMAVDVGVVFGDVELAVPAAWRVSLSPTSLFGDVKHLRAAENLPDDAPLLRVRGFTLFGDITVRQ